AEALGLHCRSVLIPLGTAASAAPARERFRHREGGAFNLLFLSRIDPKKNLEGLLQALRLVRAKYPNVTLNIAGSGNSSYLAALQSLARDLAVDDCITWLGYVDGLRKTEA